MSLDQFARRLGLASATTALQIERGEVEGSVTLKRLRTAAEALGCEVHITLVPRRPLEEFVREQAQRRAEHQLLRVRQTMQMENQNLDQSDYRELLARETEEILRRGGKQLWE